MDSAYFERAVFSLGNRVDVSVRARLFSGGTRRAIELRDRICTHPYCYEPAENCQGDHIETWAEGGPTTQENGRLLCGFHNRLRNQRAPTAAPAAAADGGLSGRRRPPRDPPVGRFGPAQTKPQVMRRFVAPETGCTTAHHETGQRKVHADADADAITAVPAIRDSLIPRTWGGSGCPISCDNESRILRGRKCSVNVDLMCDDPTKFSHDVCPSRILYSAL